MSLLVELGLETKEFTKGLKLASKDFKALGEELGRVGRFITTAVTAPIAGAAYSIFRFSAEASKHFSDFGASVKESLGEVGTDISRMIDLKGILNSMATGIKSLAKEFIELPAPIKAGIVAVLAFASTIGPIILLAGKLIAVLGTVVAILSGPVGIVVAVGAAIAAFTGLAYGMLAPKKATEEYISVMDAEIKKIDEEIKKLKERDEILKLMKYGPVASLNVPEVTEKAMDYESRKRAQEILNLEALKEIELTKQRAQALIMMNETAKRDEQRKILMQVKEGWEKSKVAMEVYSMFHTTTIDQLKSQLAAAESDYLKLRQAEIDLGNPEVQEAYRRILGLQAQVYSETQKNIDAQDDLRLKLSQIKNEVGMGLITPGEGKEKTLEELRGSLKTPGLSPDIVEQTKKQISGLTGEIDSLGFQLNKLFTQIPSLAQQAATAIYNVFQQLSVGIGNAVANVIIYGADLATSLQALLKQVAATIISTIIQIMIQSAIANATRKADAASTAGVEVGSATATGAAWTWASAVKQYGIYGLIIGAALAAIFIAGALASARSGSSSGKSIKSDLGSAATGGIFITPGLTRIAERGQPEMVLNRENIRQYFPEVAGGNRAPTVQTIVMKIDQREIARASVRGIPEYLELHGARRG